MISDSKRIQAIQSKAFDATKKLQNLPCFWNKKSQIIIYVFNFEQFWICVSDMESRECIHYKNTKIALNEYNESTWIFFSQNC